ncbi:uncharacterized protein ACMZJ9_001192 [Mantella aurantiaca]
MMTNTIVIQFGLFFFVSCSLETDIVQLDVLPNHPTYEMGEDVNFICCSADSVNSKLFELYKEESKLHSTEQSTNCTNFEIKIKTKQDAGQFQCLYQALENETYIESYKSRSITIRVAETPLPPSIRLIPLYTVYAKEETFTLTCSPPVGMSAKGIQIYWEKKKIQEWESLHSNYTISASAKNASGKYACKYLVEIYGRNISSSQSDYIIVNVTDRPLAPSLSLSPTHSVYIRGEYITITCSPPVGSNANGVNFYKDGQKISSQQKNEISISTANITDSAKYSCQYVEEILGRNISSTLSDEVTINTTGSSSSVP